MTVTTDSLAPPRNLALTAARTVAGLLGASQVAGVTYFVFIAPEEAIWLGPWIDIPVLTLLLGGMVLKLVTGLAPRLSADRRVQVGFAAVGLSVAATLLKIPLYDEPEGVTFLATDAVLLALLVLAAHARRP